MVHDPLKRVMKGRDFSDISRHPRVPSVTDFRTEISGCIVKVKHYNNNASRCRYQIPGFCHAVFYSLGTLNVPISGTLMLTTHVPFF